MNIEREQSPFVSEDMVLRMSRPFRWRDLRDFSIGVQVWPFHWSPWFKVERDDDQFGGVTTLTLGPVVLRFDYNAHDGPFGKPLPEQAREVRSS